MSITDTGMGPRHVSSHPVLLSALALQYCKEEVQLDLNPAFPSQFTAQFLVQFEAMVNKR